MRYKNIIQAIGNTPLIQINFGTPPTILAKLEHLNPGGSIKDRSALFMIEEAERNGWLKPGGTIIEASSGNQGIAAAMIGAAKGYRVIITTNEKFAKDKVNVIKAYGAELVMCKATEFVEDPESYHSIAVKLQRETPNSFMLNQYYNLSNPQAHYASLGPEIWEQTEHTITHFIGATGTCGTVIGAGRYLKEQNNTIKIIGVDAKNSHRSTGGHPKPYKLEGIGIDFDGPILQTYESIIDEFLTVDDEDGFAMLKTLAHQHALLVGPSTGAVAHAVYEYSKTCDQHDVIVMICADSGRAYVNKEYYTRNSETNFIPKKQAVTEYTL